MMKRLYMALNLLEVPVSLAAGILLHQAAKAKAFADRGYDAMGGEVLVFPFVFLLLMFVFEMVIRIVYERCRKNQNRRKHRSSRKAVMEQRRHGYTEYRRDA